MICLLSDELFQVCAMVAGYELLTQPHLGQYRHTRVSMQYTPPLYIYRERESNDQ